MSDAFTNPSEFAPLFQEISSRHNPKFILKKWIRDNKRKRDLNRKEREYDPDLKRQRFEYRSLSSNGLSSQTYTHKRRVPLHIKQLNSDSFDFNRVRNDANSSPTTSVNSFFKENQPISFVNHPVSPTESSNQNSRHVFISNDIVFSRPFMTSNPPSPS